MSAECGEMSRLLLFIVLVLFGYSSARSNWNIGKISTRKHDVDHVKSLIIQMYPSESLKEYIISICSDTLRILPTVKERINDILAKLEYDVNSGEYDPFIDRSEILFILLEIRKHYLPYGNILMLDSLLENTPITMKRYIVTVSYLYCILFYVICCLTVLITDNH